MDKRIKQANEILKELEENNSEGGVLKNLVGGFITILVGVSLISDIKNGCKN